MGNSSSKSPEGKKEQNPVPEAINNQDQNTPNEETVDYSVPSLNLSFSTEGIQTSLRDSPFYGT
jgi:hypothetical protein